MIVTIATMMLAGQAHWYLVMGFSCTSPILTTTYQLRGTIIPPVAKETEAQREMLQQESAGPSLNPATPSPRPNRAGRPWGHLGMPRGHQQKALTPPPEASLGQASVSPAKWGQRDPSPT